MFVTMFIVMNITRLTSTLWWEFVYVKYFFCISPSFRSRLFFAALRPRSRRVSDQCLGQWYLMELHFDFDAGSFKSTMASSKSFIFSWFLGRAVLCTGERRLLCISNSRSYTRANFTFDSGQMMSVVPIKSCMCLAMVMCHPPSTRRLLRMK